MISLILVYHCYKQILWILLWFSVPNHYIYISDSNLINNINIRKTIVLLPAMHESSGSSIPLPTVSIVSPSQKPLYCCSNPNFSLIGFLLRTDIKVNQHFLSVNHLDVSLMKYLLKSVHLLYFASSIDMLSSSYLLNTIPMSRGK